MGRTVSAVLKSVARNPRVLKVPPAVNLSLLRYMRKFKIRRVGGYDIVHSHLPPLNSRAYSRFIDEHLLGGSEGPSHAQVGVTPFCPQKCAYCYNRDRSGAALDTPTILKTIDELKALGVFWIGLTGGEPLVQKDLEAITAHAARDCAVKLFTTGCGLTPGRAAALRDAGLFSVSVSLDHWTADVHDKVRGYPGAFDAALKAIDLFRAAGLDVGVSAVLSREMIRDGSTETLLNFLKGLGIHEAWLSETKPSGPAYWREDAIVGEDGRKALADLQDRWNKRTGMTVNYLGHFEGAEQFGCNAGRKMIYVDAFGEVSPCVFTPMSFGNVRDRSLPEIWADMRPRFSSSSRCFMNANYRLFAARPGETLPLAPEASRQLAAEAIFAPPGKFIKRLEKRPRRSA
jgi:MoaA/NifB/PqqE/SkfB family radical SAM enzyme